MNNGKGKGCVVSSIAQEEDNTIYICCEDRDCLLNWRKKKVVLPKDQWHNQEYWKLEYAKKDKVQSHSQMAESCKVMMSVSRIMKKMAKRKISVSSAGFRDLWRGKGINRHLKSC